MSRSSRRRLGCRSAALAVLGTAVLTFAIAGCSSDDAKPVDAAKATSSTAPSTTVAPPSTVTDEDFDKTAATAEALIAASGSDPCKLLKSLSSASNLPSPINPRQTERGVQVVAALFTAAADTAPASSAADAAVLRKAATDLRAEGAAQGWDPKWLTGSPKSISDPAVATAFRNYQTQVGTTCGAPAAGGPTTSAP
jgi:hypothetical protein